MFMETCIFGVKPEIVIKGGMIAWSQMGDANASIPTPQPVYMRPMFGSFAGARNATSLTFVSQAAFGKRHSSTIRVKKISDRCFGNSAIN